MEDNEIDTFGGKLSLKKETYKYIQDEQCSSAFAKQTIARQGDLPALQRYGTFRFACGKLHSFRMPDERCSSLRSVS